MTTFRKDPTARPNTPATTAHTISAITDSILPSTLDTPAQDRHRRWGRAADLNFHCQCWAEPGVAASRGHGADPDAEIQHWVRRGSSGSGRGSSGSGRGSSGSGRRSSSRGSRGRGGGGRSGRGRGGGGRSGRGSRGRGRGGRFGRGRGRRGRLGRRRSSRVSERGRSSRGSGGG